MLSTAATMEQTSTCLQLVGCLHNERHSHMMPLPEETDDEEEDTSDDDVCGAHQARQPNLAVRLVRAHPTAAHGASIL